MTAQMAGLLAGTTGLLIDGQWEPGRAQLAVLDKYTRQQIAAVAQASPPDVGRAVTGALAAAQRPLPPARRQAILAEAARLLEERRDEIRALYVAETGFTPADAATELTRAVATLRLSAEEAVRIAGQEIPVAATPGSEHRLAFTIRVPVGVVAAITPFNAPLNTTAHKVGPAIAAGNAVVLKPAEQTPLGILVVMELIADILPPGVINVVNGFGIEAGKPLAQNKRIAKIAFTGETTTGRMIMQYASDNIIPVTLELGGKSPNIFFADVAEADDDFLDKALEGFTMFALNQGEVCTCPSRVLVQETIYDKFMEKAVARTKKIKQGHPLDPETMIGAQASNDQLEKILSYLDIGKQEGAKVLTGGNRAKMEGELSEGYYVEPTIFEGNNKMRIFQEEIFGPVVSVTKFKDENDALAIANDTLYGLGAGVWTRNGTRAYRFGRAIQAGRVWTNCYHAYPAHAAFGGYKASGIGRENHKMMLDHYQQTKNILVSYSNKALGFF